MSPSEIPEVVARLDQLDAKLDELADLLIRQRTVKDFFPIAEMAEITGRAEFTVREYCRLGRVRGEKLACGRGKHQAWVISHEELTRYRNEGLLPPRRY
jgi:hypothetical protein